MNESIVVQSSADFTRVVRPAYHALLRDGGVRALDVLIDPGVYEGRPLVLVGDNAGQLSVCVRAAAPDQPPRFVDASVSIAANSVRLERLLFENAFIDGSLVSATVGDEAQIVGCGFIGNVQGGFASHGALVRFSPARVTSTARVLIRDSWFVANRSGRDACLLRLPASPPAFESLTMENVAFVDNPGLTGVDLGGTASVDCLGCWFQSQRPVFSLFYAGTSIRVEESTLVGPSLDALFAFGAADSYRRPKLRRSELYVGDPTYDAERYSLKATTFRSSPRGFDGAALLDRIRAGALPEARSLGAFSDLDESRNGLSGPPGSAPC